ncbi:hypothetical protein BDW66DRAFT_134893, partial [Aspergillus desertorum]
MQSLSSHESWYVCLICYTVELQQISAKKKAKSKSYRMLDLDVQTRSKSANCGLGLGEILDVFGSAAV